MRYIVTGAGGFIGSALCEQLSKEGHEIVRMFRRLPNRCDEDSRKYEDIECDVLSDSFPDLRISADGIIHLAAANDIVSRDGREGIRLSVIGTKNMLDFSVNNRIDKVVFFSTIQVLGSELQGLINESSPFHPVNDYAANHVMAEIYTEMYARRGLLKAVSVRPTNVYGHFTLPTINRWSLVPACFCKEAFYNKQIILRSSGKQIRNFVSVDSVAKATSALLSHFPDSYDILNIGSSCHMSILEVAQMVKKVHDEIYSEPAQLILQGKQLEQENLFEISLHKLEERYGFRQHLGSEELQRQIRLIFSDLEKRPLSGS